MINIFVIVHQTVNTVHKYIPHWEMATYPIEICLLVSGMNDNYSSAIFCLLTTTDAIYCNLMTAACCVAES